MDEFLFPEGKKLFHVTVCDISVSEIKGAPCTRSARFYCHFCTSFLEDLIYYI